MFKAIRTALKKPSQYKLDIFYREQYGHNFEQKYHRIFLKYKYIPFWVKLNKDYSHSFFKQLFASEHTRWDRNATGARIHSDVKKWFQDPPPRELPPKNVYDF